MSVKLPNVIGAVNFLHIRYTRLRRSPMLIEEILTLRMSSIGAKSFTEIIDAQIFVSLLRSLIIL